MTLTADYSAMQAEKKNQAWSDGRVRFSSAGSTMWLGLLMRRRWSKAERRR
jgi:hypothetical protein